MFITNMIHQVEDDKHSMVIIPQFYSPTCTGIVQEAGEPSTKPKRRQRKRNSSRDGGGSGFAGLKKRKLTTQQAELLEMHFGNEHKLESERKEKLAAELGLDPRQVAVWFQNRRARDKTKRIEESYSNLKAAHENAASEKSQLEAEVGALKEKLSIAEEEIKKMTEIIEGIGLNNLSPMSLPVDMDSSVDSPFALDPYAGQPGWVDHEDFFLVQQNYISAAEWLFHHMN